jgi:hypothetical protein
MAILRGRWARGEGIKPSKHEGYSIDPAIFLAKKYNFRNDEC